jgi:hypothetical protein
MSGVLLAEIADPNAACLRAAAAGLDVPARYEPRRRTSSDASPDRWLRLDIAGRSFFYRDGMLRHGADGDTLGPDINGVAPAITGHAVHTREFLAIRGVPTPVGALFAPSERKKALAFFRAMARPMRIRSNRRDREPPGGARIDDVETFASAFDAAALRLPEILVEECVVGAAVRYLYVDPHAVAAMPGQPAGDEDGGGVACADSTHPSYAAVAEAACRAIPGLVLAGVDMVIGDRGRPAAPGNHWVVGIDGAPVIHAFHYLCVGQDAGGAILRFLLRGGRE